MKNFKQALRAFACRTVLSPPTVRYCSQSIYETLLGCCRMWEATGEILWRNRATKILRLLTKIQQPDGGFDNGYDFNFGRLHKRGQSSSPELIGLVALCEYARLFDKEEVEDQARRAAEWIRKHALTMKAGKVAIPYCPEAINEVMVYNGTSFACGALGCYLGQFGGDEHLHSIYAGFVQYLESVLSKKDDFPGRFWYYNDQSRDDLNEQSKNKIDYYHQMQQVEIHTLAQQASPAELQLVIIREAADHIVALHEQKTTIPYTNDSRLFKGQIHLWGFSSVASGMLEAALVIPDRSEVYRQVARDVLDWILKHAWNGQHFEAILQKNGAKVDPRYYMVRSDAWVFNAFAAGGKHLEAGPWAEVAETCYQKMASVDFSGPESHATNRRVRIANKTASKVLRLMRSLGASS